MDGWGKREDLKKTPLMCVSPIQMMQLIFH